MKKLLFLSGLLFLFFAGGCNSDRWDGIVFPDKENLLIYYNVGPFQSMEECKNASMAKLGSLNAIDHGFYECGKNCRAPSSSYDRGCEESERGNLYR